MLPIKIITKKKNCFKWIFNCTVQDMTTCLSDWQGRRHQVMPALASPSVEVSNCSKISIFSAKSLLSFSAIHFTSCSTARNPHACIYIQKWCTYIKCEPNFIRERRSYLCSYNALHSPAPTRRHTTIHMLKNVSVSLSHLYCYGLRSLSCTLKLLMTCQKDTAAQIGPMHTCTIPGQLQHAPKTAMAC